MTGLAVRTGAALSVVGVTSATLLDVAIDRSGHDHDSLAFRLGYAPTNVLLGGGIGLVGAGALARAITNGTAARYPATLIALGSGALGAWAVTSAVRMGTGLLFDPRGTGVRFDPSDLAANGANRARMQGLELRSYEHSVLDALSRAQGHGSLDDRAARGEFEPQRTG